MKDDIHLCPWYMGYALLLPIRKLEQNPAKILKPYLKEGMKVMDYGSAMGFFSIPAAKLIGSSGEVHCFDIQERMFTTLNKRAVRRKLNNIVTHLIKPDGNDFSNMKELFDFGILNAVAHETYDRKKLFVDLSFMLKHDSKLFFGEPKSHVSKNHIDESLAYADIAGLKVALKISDYDYILVKS